MKGKELKKIIHKSGVRIERILEESGINESTFYSLYRDSNAEKEIKLSYLKKLQKTALWEFIPAELIPREMLVSPKPDLDHIPEFNISNILRALPVSGIPNCIVVPLKAQAGFAMDYENVIKSDQLQRIFFPLIQGECFMFEVEGFSMMPDYPPGSWVVASLLEKPEYITKGRVYVFQNIEGIIIKQFEKIEDGKYHLRSLNADPEYKIKPIPLKSVKKVYHIEFKLNKP